MDNLVFSNKRIALAFEEEEIRRKEPELFIKHIAEMNQYSTLCGRTLTAADTIAHSLTYITAMYAEATKRVMGGWTCGTYISHVCTALSYKISSKYNDDQLFRFIEACVNCIDDWKSFLEADKDINDMTEVFLTMRPTPCVHPPASWWRKTLEGED